MTDQPRRLLGGLRPSQFMQRHWQREALLVRGALPGFRSPLEPEELAGLACEEGIESRLVLEHGGERPWELSLGPFEAERFTRLPDSHWTVLVSDLDKVVPALADLVDVFDFLPRWRIDDIMVSYAAPFGGVGPHVDSYDVFLLQGQGRRRWSIDTRDHRQARWREDCDLRILSDFQPGSSWVLEPGDMLYLPPGVAHEGVALEPCMTFSVGFRAPTQADLAAAWVEQLLPGLDPASRYDDSGTGPVSEPGLISQDTLGQVGGLLAALPREPAAIAEWFGRLATATTPGHSLQPRRRALRPERLLERLGRARRLRWRPACRRAYTELDGRVTLFAGGEAWVLEPGLAELGPILTRGRDLPLDLLRPHLHANAPLLGLLADLLDRGCLEIR